MPIPDYQSLMLPLLRFCNDRQEHTIAEIRQGVSLKLGLTDDELTERLPSKSQPLFPNRIGWAVQYLKSAATIRAVRRGVYQITDRGLSLLKSQPSDKRCSNTAWF